MRSQAEAQSDRAISSLDYNAIEHSLIWKSYHLQPSTSVGQEQVPKFIKLLSQMSFCTSFVLVQSWRVLSVSTDPDIACVELLFQSLWLLRICENRLLYEVLTLFSETLTHSLCPTLHSSSCSMITGRHAQMCHAHLWFWHRLHAAWKIILPKLTSLQLSWGLFDWIQRKGSDLSWLIDTGDSWNQQGLCGLCQPKPQSVTTNACQFTQLPRATSAAQRASQNI